MQGEKKGEEKVLDMGKVMQQKERNEKMKGCKPTAKIGMWEKRD